MKKTGTTLGDDGRGQLAGTFRPQRRTLQFYEKEGLIRADRDDSNYRRFSPVRC